MSFDFFGDGKRPSFANAPILDDVHFPCGHWHKGNIPRPEDVGEMAVAENYFEMLPSADGATYLVSQTSLIAVDTETMLLSNDFDGDCSWEFEVIANNPSDLAVTVEVVDGKGVSCASIVVPANKMGPTTWELFRYRATANLTGQGLYYVSVSISSDFINSYYPNQFNINCARLILTQTNFTKTKVQVPLFWDSSLAYSSFVPNTNTQTGASQEDYADVVLETPAYAVPPFDGSLNGLHDSGKVYENYEEVIESRNFCPVTWKYDISEISQASQIVFEATATPPKMYLVDNFSVTLWDTGGMHAGKFCLYMSPDNLGAPVDNPVPYSWVSENQVHTQDGSTFTPFSNTLIEVPGDGANYDNTIVKDISTGYLDTSGAVTLYMAGSFDTGLGTVWVRSTALFDIHLPVDTNATIQIHTTHTGGSTSVSFTCEIILTKPTGSAVVGLWDKTANSVPYYLSFLSSENEDNLQFPITKRKVVTLDPSHDYSPVFAMENVLINQHPDNYQYGAAAYIAKSQLWLNVNPVTHLTYRRVIAAGFVGLTGYYREWDVPFAWGGSYWNTEHGYTTDGSVDNSHRVLVTGVAGLEFYLEAHVGAPAWDRLSYWSSEVVADLFCVLLSDLTIDDASGSGANALDVSDSKIVLWQNQDDGYQYKCFRSQILSLAKNGIYGIRLPDTDFISLNLGYCFLVIKVK